MRPETSDLVWKSKNGRSTKIKDMDTRHLVNTIKLIERGDHGTVKEGHKLHHALKDELAFRSLSQKQEKILVRGIDQEATIGLMGKKEKFDESEKAS